MKKLFFLCVSAAFSLSVAATTLSVDTTAVATSTDSVALVKELIDIKSALNAKFVQEVFSDTAFVGKYNRLLDKLTADYNASVDSILGGANSAIQHEDNPMFFRLFAPLTLYASPVQSAFSLDSINESVQSELDRVLMQTYLSNPSHVVQTESQLMSSTGVSTETIKQSSENAALTVKVETPVAPVNPAVAPADMVVTKPNFWTTKGSFSNQWTESYFSPNWYQSGVPNLNALSTLTIDANYNDKQKVQWDNRLEARIGFNQANFYKDGDEKGEIQANEDLLRLTSKLGLKAIRSWNYSVQFQTYTQMMNKWKGTGDSRTLHSSFISPLYGSLSVGMDWKKSFKKGGISVFIGPLTYNARYVNDDYVLENSGFINRDDDGTFHHYYNDFGSKLEVTFNYTLFKNVSYKTRFYYYTPYNYVQADWENTLNFQVSKYLSAQLFFHTRYDDNRVWQEAWGNWNHLQLKEFLTLGINYAW